MSESGLSPVSLMVKDLVSVTVLLESAILLKLNLVGVTVSMLPAGLRPIRGPSFTWASALATNRIAAAISNDATVRDKNTNRNQRRTIVTSPLSLDAVQAGRKKTCLPPLTTSV